MRFKLLLIGMTLFGFAFSQTKTFNAIDQEGKWLVPASEINVQYFHENKLEILGLSEQNHL